MPPLVPVMLGALAAIAIGWFLVRPALSEAERADQESEGYLAVAAKGRAAERASRQLLERRATLRAELELAPAPPVDFVESLRGCGDFMEFWTALARLEQEAVVRSISIERDPGGEEIAFEVSFARASNGGSR